MQFAKKLSYYRERAKLNKTELANRLSCSLGYIINLEAGRKKPPTSERLDQLVNILKLSKPEKQEFLSLAAEGRIPEKDKALLGKQPKEIEVKESAVPIVSAVGATDEVGHANFEAFDPPYQAISFKNCKAVVVESNSMAPIAYKGQKIIYSESEPVGNGELAFIKLKKGAQLFKRFYKNHNKIITLQSINPTEPFEPIIVKEKDIEFCYKVIAVKF